VTDAPPTPTDAPDAPDAPVADAPETDPVRDALVAQLTEQFGDAILESRIVRGELWVRVANEQWHDVAAFCKETLGFRFFNFLGGMDWLNNPNLSAEKTWDFDAEPVAASVVEPGYAGGAGRFQVLCRLENIQTHVAITFKVDLADDAPSLPTITDVFAGADWHERETWEMYGFEFTGHPGLRHLYLPGAFEGFPQRKDFPLLARDIKPWPGLVDKEPMPGEDAEPDEEAAAE